MSRRFVDIARKTMVPVILGAALSGCFAMRADYTPPRESVEERTSRSVARPQAQVIQSVLRNTPGRNFQVDLIDRESGRIDVSFSGDPERYVNCGMVNILASNIEGHDTYEFPIARERQAFRGWADGGISPMEQSSRLDARASILLAADGRDRTSVAVSTTYNFRRRIQQPGIVGFSHETAVSFTGREVGRAPGEPERMVCVSNGVFPEEIFTMLN